MVGETIYPRTSTNQSLTGMNGRRREKFVVWTETVKGEERICHEQLVSLSQFFVPVGHNFYLSHLLLVTLISYSFFLLYDCIKSIFYYHSPYPAT
jgi:hypothetical protein